MKEVATIESVEFVRKYQRPDGTFQNVHRVIYVSPSGKVAAETSWSTEYMEKIKLLPGAIGTIEVAFDVRKGIGEKSGQPYCIQDIKLRSFVLANSNLTNQPSAPAADPAPEAQEAKINPETGMPF